VPVGRRGSYGFTVSDASPTWRTALRPKWLALLGVVVVLCVAFGWLGHWQLDVAKSKEHPNRSGTSAPVAPLDQVTQPQQSFKGDMVGRRVTVSGQFDPSRQVLVAGKRQGGVDGVWVVTALRVPSGALVPVVRGFASSAAVAAAGGGGIVPAADPVTVSGALQPPEAGASPGPSVPAGTVPAADTAYLVNAWGGPIYNVLLFDAAAPPAGSAGVALTPVPARSVEDGGSLGLRNAAYALQWWLFGAFALLLWWRMVRQDAIDEVAHLMSAPHPHEPKELTAP
jgi:surfeit locus 1 family protein